MHVLSFDTETSISDSIHGPSFRDKSNDIYTQIFAAHPKTVEVVHNENGFKRKLATSLYDVDLLIGHNLSFDLCYLISGQDEQFEKFILKGGEQWDTQLAEYLLTGQQHTFSSLAELQFKYLKQKIKSDRISYLYKKRIGADKIVKARNRCKRLFALYEEYCRSDGSTPLLIFKAQYERAKKEGMLELIKMVNAYALTLSYVSCTGICLDLEKVENSLREFNLKHIEYLEQARNILIKNVWTDKRLPPFNINSPDHKSAALFGGTIKVIEKRQVGYYKPKPIYEEIETGIYTKEEFYDAINDNYYTVKKPIIKRQLIGFEESKPKYKNFEIFIDVKGFGIPKSFTYRAKKEGLYATDDAVMKRIATHTKNEDVKTYCELQKKSMMFKKAAKTYCQAFLDRNIDGKLYPHFNTTLTKTGRLSSSEPNLQNVSKRNEFGKILHSMFVAPKGWKCVQIDFSQLEIWVLAWLSDDALLIKHLLDGTDLHIVRLQYYNSDKTYEELYKLCKVDKDPYWDKQRTFAKTVSYQMAYGAMPPKVTESTGLDLEIVKTIFEKEAQTYVDAANFSVKVRESIEKTATYSKAYDIPASEKRGKNGHNVFGNVELLPIFDKDKNVCYNKQSLRRVGYWQSPTGMKFHFLDSGREYKGKLNRSFSFTQPKNYPMQGTAANIQGATTAALLRMLVEKKDKIQMINEVHDSKWFYVREDVLDNCLKHLKTTIENVPKIFLEKFNLEVPFNFPVEIEVGDNFAEMTKYQF